jgi:hypothetical protein
LRGQDKKLALTRVEGYKESTVFRVNASAYEVAAMCISIGYIRV